MTLGATFSSLTQKQIDAEKQANKSVENATATATTASTIAVQAKNTADEASNKVEEINQVVVEQEGTFVKTTTFETYQKTVESTYAKTDDVTSLKTSVNSSLENIYTKNETYSKEEIDALISELKGDS